MIGFTDDSYTRNVEEPDKEIKPYINFIKKHNIARCDLEVCDTDECDVLFPYNFSYYSLRHKYDWVILSAGFLYKEKTGFKSLDQLDELVKSFNLNHPSKLSYLNIERKKWFFNKEGYKPYLTLQLESPLSKNPIIINNTITTFYKNLHSLITEESFEAFIRNSQSSDEDYINFLKYLETVTAYLDLLRSLASKK